MSQEANNTGTHCGDVARLRELTIASDVTSHAEQRPAEGLATLSTLALCPTIPESIPAILQPVPKPESLETTSPGSTAILQHHDNSKEHSSPAAAPASNPLRVSITPKEALISHTIQLTTGAPAHAALPAIGTQPSDSPIMSTRLDFAKSFTPRVTSHHSLHSLDAVWREPLNLPHLKAKMGSVSGRVHSLIPSTESQDESRAITDPVTLHHAPAALPRFGLMGSGTVGDAPATTEPSQQRAHSDTRVLKDSSKANVSTSNRSDSVAPKQLSSPLKTMQHQQQHRLSEGAKDIASLSMLPESLLATDFGSLAPFSMWEYLKEEVMATDIDNTQDMRWDRVSNFMAVPWQCEKMIIFGFVICLDSFLYTFTILPLRFAVAATLGCRNVFFRVTRPSTPHLSLHSSHKCDIVKTALLVISCFILSRVTDASKMYHSVRGQETIKLYVIFNVLEIVDRLCCSLGQDLLDALFSRRSLGRQSDGRQPLVRPLHLFVLALLYIQVHTVILFYQLVTLNVAINSYDNALLTLLLSNQFVEIKGAVFKKFEKENLFQMTCADIVERFQLTLILCAIGVRNLIEVTSGGDNSTSPASRPRGGPLGDVPLPRSFTVLPSWSALATSFAPVIIVLGSECVVDWLKHAFITKFNHIRPSVYGRFMDVLCRDLVFAGPADGDHSDRRRSNAQCTADRSEKRADSSNPSYLRRRNTFVDQSPILSRRLGFAALPLACLLARISVQIYGMLGDDSHYDECAVHPSIGDSEGVTGVYMVNFLRKVFSGQVSVGLITATSSLQVLAWSLPVLLGWVFLVVVKVLLGTALFSFAHYRYNTMAQREVEEELNDRNRPHIGVSNTEVAYEDQVKQVLGGDSGLAPPPTPVQGAVKRQSPGTSLMNVDRYTMVKSRLW